MNEEELIEKYMPSAEDLETASNVLFKLAVLWEESAIWWEKIFFTANQIRRQSERIRELAFKRRQYDLENVKHSGSSADAGS